MRKDMGASAEPTGPGAPKGAEPSGLGASPAIPNAEFRRTRKELRDLPRPRNMAELAALSAWYFGVPLQLSRMFYHSYEIAESFDSYNGRGKPAWSRPTADGSKPRDNCGYDYSRDFWAHVFGELSCGGVARASYGQFTPRPGHREKLRLKSLQYSRREGRGGSSVRPSLARLAPNGGGGENIGSGNRPSANDVPTEGRVDGATAVSLTLAAGSGTAETRETAAQCEASQSGGEAVTPTPPHHHGPTPNEH